MDWITYSVQWTANFVRWFWNWSVVGQFIIILAVLLLGSIFLRNKKAFFAIVIVFIVVILGSFAINAWFTIGVPGL